MKRTLLAAALCSITLGGAVYADNLEKVEIKPSGSILQIPEDLTSDGKPAICFATTEYVYRNQCLSASFQLYDKYLNPTRTFEWQNKDYEYNLYKKTATCEITNRRILKYGGDTYTVSYNDTLLNSMEEFKGYIREKIASADVSDNAFFTDDNGNWSCTYSMSEPSSYSLNGLGVKNDEIAIYEYYNYYDKSDKRLHRNYRIFATTIDEQALTWEIDETQTKTDTAPSLLLGGRYTDFGKDKSFDELYCMSQSPINNEDKYLFFITEPNNIPGSYYETELRCSFPQEKFNVSVKLTKGEYDNYYSPYTYYDLIASNEDGEELFRIKNVYNMNDVFRSSAPYTLFRSNGKLYIQCAVYSLKYNEEKKRYDTYTENVIYLIKSQNGTGVTEVSRTKPMKIEKTFNTAGMPVSKDSHGIIIADNGMKYINK